jgi:hypothetical protein
MWRVFIFLMLSSCLWAGEAHPVLALVVVFRVITERFRRSGERPIGHPAAD